MPAGVLNVVPGGAEAGAALCGHPGVDKITFTGGNVAARAVAEAAADTTPRWCSSSAASPRRIVFDDADPAGVGKLAAILGRRAEQRPGLLPAHPAPGAALVLRRGASTRCCRRWPGSASATRSTPPRRMGPSPARPPATASSPSSPGPRPTATGRSWPADRRAGGALAAGSYVEPTVFGDVDPDSPLAQEEIFGPVLAILPFDDEDEAIEIANRTRYGLAGYVWTNDLRRAHRVADALDAGYVSVNGMASLPPSAPFGGWKASGHGVEGGRWGLEEFRPPEERARLAALAAMSHDLATDHADLLRLATTDEERTFAIEALGFLAAHAKRKAPEALAWGEGPEGLAIFHETSGEEERSEAAAARTWQATRWAAGFGWLTGPAGPRRARASARRSTGSTGRWRAAFDVPDLSPVRIGLSTVGPSLLINGTDEQVRRFAVPHPAGRDHRLPAVLRARCGVRPRGGDHRRGPRRCDVVGPHRAEGLDVQRPARRRRPRARADRSATRRSTRASRCSSSRWTRRAWRCGPCASSPAGRASPRCSSTGWSWPTTSASATWARGGGSRSARSRPSAPPPATGPTR